MSDDKNKKLPFGDSGMPNPVAPERSQRYFIHKGVDVEGETIRATPRSHRETEPDPKDLPPLHATEYVETKEIFKWVWPEHTDHKAISQAEDETFIILRCISCQLDLLIPRSKFDAWLYNKILGL